MEFWQLLLFVGASVLALRSLVSLMAHHKRSFRQEMMRGEQDRIKSQAYVGSRPSEQADGEVAA